MPRIRILPPETARLIAAGEVIDRPAALLRELLDNAIDAGAHEIRVEIEGGGIASTLVMDDGEGMNAEDLALSILPHATSKIRSADDLLTARSLGFRGEALASIAAAAILEITSKTEEMREARRLCSQPGSDPTIEATAGQKGTRVIVKGLFDNFPARRQFLKRAQAESSLCKQVFIDKAMAHPAVAFRLSSEGQLLVQTPACASFKERVLSFHGDLSPELVHEVSFSGEGFEGRVVLAGPSWYRTDRRAMGTFVNRRRVQDWSLLTGLDWSYEGLLPGGAHPFAMLFVEVDPALADFNIHPAKREVRFRDPGAIRHAMTRAIRDFLARLVRERPESAMPEAGEALSGSLFEGEGRGSAATGGWGHGVSPRGESIGEGFDPPARSETYDQASTWEGLLREKPFERARSGTGAAAPSNPREEWPNYELRYLGQAFGLFLVVERGEELFLIDQHAAHERLIYDELSLRAPTVQELLVPVRVRVDSEAEERRLASLAPAITQAGFSLELEDGEWQLTALPAALREDPEGALRELIEGGSEDPARSARAMSACKTAIKDGEILDPISALELARRALDLPEPRCPHGRPVWVRLTREDLFRLVRRIV
ncbi:MAG TPA: DNA mismatch repair endonuclease MutL [Rectinemataceae bacterium]|nr:DNA mismatch repair endonuclease MutL [Rectinemataceae bacterium]